METESFTYEPLTEGDSIRLLLLEPDSRHDAELRGRLMHTTLADCDAELIEPFTALSYVWGNQRTGTIYLGHHYPGQGSPDRQTAFTAFTITKTLDAALRDVRDATRVHRVWADALCIDQSNVEERNFQVALMGGIYSTANHTVIHLGALTPGAGEVLDVVRRRSGGEYWNSRSPEHAAIISTAQEDLLSREWFARVWILQELVLSQDPWVQCGDLRVRWAPFCDLLLLSTPPLPGTTTDGMERLRMLEGMKKSRTGSTAGYSAGWMLDLLKARRGLGATVTHDFVYAHLGIVSDLARFRQFVDIDYAKPAAVIFAQTAQYIVERSRHGLGDLLALLDDVDDPREALKDGLPSWAPHWRDTAGVLKAEMHKDNKRSQDVMVGTCHRFLHDFGVLGHLGYTVDVIEDTSVVLGLPEIVDAGKIKECEQLVADIQALYQRKGGFWYSGDENGQYVHVSLRGAEEEHEGLCRALAQQWQAILGEITEKSTESAAPYAAFVKSFTGWLEDQAASQRIFVGQESSGLTEILWRYFLPRATSCMQHRRLVRTASGRFGVAPSRARSGDVVAYLEGCPLAVVLRRCSPSGYAELDAALERDFKEAGVAMETDKNIVYWSAAESFNGAEHVTIVGHGYLDGVIGWPKGERPENITVFAIH